MSPGAAGRWVRDPVTVVARKQMADLYRRIRRDRPDMARLLWRRLSAAEAELLRRLWWGEGPPGDAPPR